jgi:hypothetical protein
MKTLFLPALTALLLLPHSTSPAAPYALLGRMGKIRSARTPTRRPLFHGKGLNMRRVVMSALSLCGLVLVGCHHECAHGVCDCQFDDHCCTRAPWIQVAHAGFGAPVALPAAPVEVAPPPAKDMPKGPAPKLE